MVHRLSLRALRDAPPISGCIAVLFLLGLVALGGCHSSSGLPWLWELQITPTNPSVAAGTSLQLTATGIYNNNTHTNATDQVLWTTSNTAVATVDASTGKVLGVAPGTATLKASLRGVNATTTLTVTSASLVSIAITPPTPSIATGTSEQLSATGTFSDNTTQNLTADLTWTSSNTTVVTVSSSGQIGTVGPGSATITATCQVASICGALAGSATVTVTPAVLVSIAITPPAPSIALGTSETFTATGTYSDNSTQNLTTQVTWNSATPAVATISNASGTNGVTSSVTTGSTLIAAVLGGVTSSSVTLTVTSATLMSIAITPPAPSIALGTSETFAAIGTYSDNSTQNLTTQVTWNSATPAVATISNASGTAGVATSVATGTTLVTAVVGGVTSPAVTLTVTSAVLVSIAITPTSPSVEVTGTQQLIATGTYSDNSTQILTGTVTWTSSDASIAAISNATGSQGLATGLVNGSTSISAALGSVSSPTVTLTVTVRVASTLHSFTGTSDGQGPVAGLIQGTDGNFYGTTSGGGTSGNGAVFKVTPAGVETVLYSFAGGTTDGSDPEAGLIQGTDGNFYGTTRAGGTSNDGTVFKVTSGGVETVLYSFAGGNDGAYPLAALIQGTDGNFYGTTQQGGPNIIGGTVFKVTPAGVETVLYAFTYGSDGGYSEAALIQGTDGNFYGTTAGAGDYDHGVVFKVTPTGVETVLHTFTGGNDGGNSYGALIQGTDGNFYGATEYGGTYGAGAVFQVTPAGIETVLYSFTGGGGGGYPVTGLLQASDGNFYGTTSNGGTSGAGTIFEVTPAGIETSLYSFTGGNDGGYPDAVLIQGTDGNFYGTTEYGGTEGDGVIFKF